MVSQFVSTHQVTLLGDLDFDFPKGTHAVGRLDNHSEGLLILTTNKKVTRLLFSGETVHERTYLVQVNNLITDKSLEQLRTGVSFKIKTGETFVSSPCKVSIVKEPEKLFNLGERLTAYPPYTWLLITITEGKYHQVRKMIAAVRHKCKRLIRVSIEDLELGNLGAGKVRELEESAFFKKLKIDSW